MAVQTYKYADKILVYQNKVCIPRQVLPFKVRIVTPSNSVVWGFWYYGASSLVVDWGDTQSSTLNGTNAVTHTYATAGTYYPQFTSGTATQIRFGWDENPNGSVNNNYLKEVCTPIPASLGLTSAYAMFAGCWYLSTWCANFFDAASANITDIEMMLASVGAASTRFNESVSGWNTAKVTKARRTFWYAYPFTGTGLQNWDVSKVEDMLGTFQWCYLAFTGSTITGWNTIKNQRFWVFLDTTNQFSADISGFKWDACTTAASMLNNPLGLWSSANYDAMLNAIAAGNHKDSVALGVGGTKYTAAGQASRTHLVSTHGWTITDGGLA